MSGLRRNDARLPASSAPPDRQAGSPEDFRELLRTSGITPGKPLHAILTTIHEASETALATVTDKARGLTPAAEKELVKRLVEVAADAMEREASAVVKRLDWRNLVLAVLIGAGLAGGGYWLGQRSRGDTVQAASFLGVLAENNSVRELEAHCRAHAYQQGGGVACQLPPLWLRHLTRETVNGR
ncbi:MAG: hypothetical protein AB7F35_01015 [Acetobacteraceae bacterium]